MREPVARQRLPYAPRTDEFLDHTPGGARRRGARPPRRPVAARGDVPRGAGVRGGELPPRPRVER